MRPLSFEFGAIEIEREYTGFDTSVYRVFGGNYECISGWIRVGVRLYRSIHSGFGSNRVVRSACYSSLTSVSRSRCTCNIYCGPQASAPASAPEYSARGHGRQGRGRCSCRTRFEEGQNAVVVQILGLWHRA